MKKIQWRLFFIALMGICFAFTSRTPRRTDYHTYYFLYKTVDQTKYYVYWDLTAMGWVQGDQYDCNNIHSICTIIAPPVYMHTDYSGTWFYANDVPASGINWGGALILMEP
jgi:hypothetical protein